MKISKRAKKTMPQSWIDFFEEAKKWKWSKYFDDYGYQCTAYEPEHDTRRVVQIAERRFYDCGASYTYFDAYSRKYYGKIIGKDNFCIYITYVCSSPLHGGIWVFDPVELRQKGYFKKKDLVPRGENMYHEVPLSECKKACDLWEIPKILGGKTLYRCAIWQYQDMITRKAKTGKCDYDSVKTWQDLPDFCFWKFMNPDGSIIEGREEAFKAYVAKTKKDARYLPRYDEEVKDDA